MQYQFPANIKQLVTAQLATGKYSSENDVLFHALRTLKEYNESVADIEDGIADEVAGRTRPLHEVDADIRQKLGFIK